MENCTKICYNNVFVTFTNSNPNLLEVITTIANVVVNISSSILTAVGNGSICYVTLTKQRFHTPSNILIAGLPFTDFLTGVIVQHLYIGHLISKLYRKVFCRLALTSYYFSYLCATCSLLTLLSVTLQRWLAIIFPFKHSVLVSCRKCYYCLAFIWMPVSITHFASFFTSCFSQSHIFVDCGFILCSTDHHTDLLHNAVHCYQT